MEWIKHLFHTSTCSTDNWVTPPNVEYFKVLVPTEINLFDQTNEVKLIRTPPIATRLAVI